MMKAIYRKREQLTNAISTFWFEPARPLRFTAGQFTELTLKHASPDDRGVKRWFTISSSPTDDLVGITTKFAGEASSSFKKALFDLAPTTEVQLAEAMGDFVLPKLTQQPLIFVAGGIGLTPFHSMFEWLAATGETRDIKFLYAVSSEDDIIFQDTFDKANVHATIIVGNPSEAWGGLRGRLDAQTILGLEKPTDDTLIYLSGPEQMIEALEADLQKHGVDKRQLVGDFFPGYTQL
jgi:ferredoxin-NADP reductase